MDFLRALFEVKSGKRVSTHPRHHRKKGRGGGRGRVNPHPEGLINLINFWVCSNLNHLTPRGLVGFILADRLVFVLAWHLHSWDALLKTNILKQNRFIFAAHHI